MKRTLYRSLLGLLCLNFWVLRIMSYVYEYVLCIASYVNVLACECMIKLTIKPGNYSKKSYYGACYRMLIHKTKYLQHEMQYTIPMFSWLLTGSISCEDPECFVRGGSNLDNVFFLVFKGIDDPNSIISGPSSARQRNAI